MDQSFEQHLQDLRPRLHRYCARMTGSTVDGEDVVQTTLLKALQAKEQMPSNPEAWLFRIAHNASIDHLRSQSRRALVTLTDDIAAAPEPEPDIVALSFQTFLRLPQLQRCAVILKDVLGHSIADIATIADCTAPAAKSALQRGRATLRNLARRQSPTAPVSPQDEQTLLAYVQHFRDGDFDAIRAMLADDVKLDLVNRLKLDGKYRVTPYFTRYAKSQHWHFAPGTVEGRPAMLVFDADAMDRPTHFVLFDWQDGRAMTIRDFLFAPYVVDGADWTRTPPAPA